MVTFMNTWRKYGRTPHLPFSKSRTIDDLDGKAFPILDGKTEIIVSEKMDGENTTFYNDKFHARSMDSLFHDSRSWVAGFWGGISWMIPEGRRIILENCFAEHSIRYDDLETFAFGIGVVDMLDENGVINLETGEYTFRSWDDTLEIMNILGITPVRVLYRGPAIMKTLEEIFHSLDHKTQEGIVIRPAAAFLEKDFEQSVAKAVRKGHVQTSEHWLRTWKPNSLKKT